MQSAPNSNTFRLHISIKSLKIEGQLELQDAEISIEQEVSADTLKDIIATYAPIVAKLVEQA